MSIMRKFLIGMTLLGTTVAVTPVAAQNYGGYGYDQGYHQSNQRLQQIGQRIARLTQRGAISQRESYSLRREYAYLVRLDRNLQRGGLSRWERQELNRRTQLLAQRVRQTRNDGRWNDDRRYDDRDDRRDDRREWRGRDDDDDDRYDDDDD